MSYTLSISENFNKNSVNFYSSSASKIVGPNSEERNSISFKRGSFTLNDKQITIKDDDSLESIAKKINKVSGHTGITAKIEKSGKGHKLHLFSKKSTVEIKDQAGVLAKLYNKGHIGTSGKHLIQFTSGAGPVTILYNKSASAQATGLSLLLQMADIRLPTPIGNPLVVLNEIPVENEILEEPINEIPVENEILEEPTEEVNAEHEIAPEEAREVPVENNYYYQWGINLYNNYAKPVVNTVNNFIVRNLF